MFWLELLTSKPHVGWVWSYYRIYLCKCTAPYYVTIVNKSNQITSVAKNIKIEIDIMEGLNWLKSKGSDGVSFLFIFILNSMFLLSFH